jgi:hypothetical protein
MIFPDKLLGELLFRTPPFLCFPGYRSRGLSGMQKPRPISQRRWGFFVGTVIGY